MSHRILFSCVALFFSVPLLLRAQFPNANANKAPGNNYRHAPNTIIRTADDTLVVKVKGSGSLPVILITDYMQDESMYDEIVERHGSKAQFHIAIPAGMGGTPAYSWPEEAEEFISRPWTSEFEGELIDYIDRHGLTKPAIVTTWPFGMNAALHLAKDYPDKIGSILVVGQTQNTPLFRAYPYDSMHPGKFDIDKQRAAADNFIAFWKHVDTHTWFSNSFRPSFYSSDREFGLNMAYKRAFHEIPLMIRYWTEYVVTDLPEVITELSVPFHVISVIRSEEQIQQLLDRAGMTTLNADGVLDSIRKAAKDDWMAEKENITINFIEDSGLMVWHDKPEEFDRIFTDFISQTDSKAGFIGSTERFEFYSNFWINMHHMWFRKATQSQDTVWHASFDQSFITQLNEDEKATLQKTIDYYREYLVGNSLLFNGALYRVKRLLIQFGRDTAVTAEDWPEAKDFLALLNDSKEIYQNYFWEDHNRQNSRVLNDHLELIRKFEKPALERISALAQQPWPEGKIRVDISYYANWAGAYTSTSPETHVVIASRAEKIKNDWLELLFHEPSHAIISGDEYMIGETIQKVSEELKINPPRQLWHSLLFYFSGVVIQDLLKAEGVDYELYMIRNDVFGRHHEVILKYMPEYINGNSELDEALKKLITAYND